MAAPNRTARLMASAGAEGQAQQAGVACRAGEWRELGIKHCDTTAGRLPWQKTGTTCELCTAASSQAPAATCCTSFGAVAVQNNDRCAGASLGCICAPHQHPAIDPQPLCCLCRTQFQPKCNPPALLPLRTPPSHLEGPTPRCLLASGATEVTHPRAARPRPPLPTAACRPAAARCST